MQQLRHSSLDLLQTEIALVGTETFNTTYGSEAEIGAGGSWDWSSITEYAKAVYGTGEAATHPAVTAGASRCTGYCNHE